MEINKRNENRTVRCGVIAMLAVLFCMLWIGRPAQAATRTAVTSGYTWDAASGTLIVTSNAGTTSWQTAIQDRTAVRHVLIASGVTTIRERAFMNCTALTDVQIADTVGYIGSYAFGNCTALACISLPYETTTVAENALRGSGVNSITLGDAYVIPGWLETVIETQVKRSRIVSYVLYVPTSMIEYYESNVALIAHEKEIVIDVQPVTASPYAATVALTDADSAGYKAFCAEVARQITSAATDAVVTITTEQYLSFDHQVYTAIEARQDVELVVHYVYHGEAHTFYIVPGTNAYFLYGGQEYISFRYLESKLSNDQD